MLDGSGVGSDRVLEGPGVGSDGVLEGPGVGSSGVFVVSWVLLLIKPKLINICM